MGKKSFWFVAVASIGVSLGLAPESSGNESRDSLLVSENFAGFLATHPDLLHYRLGVEAYRKDDFGDAMRHFRVASKFSDKPSQALVAEMYWQGVGVPADRALAYAWMDLAAERGYPRMLVMRERYWDAMSAEEQERAIAVGQDIYGEFGDDIAKPRLETVLRRKMRTFAGSRTGYTGNTKIMGLMPGTMGAADDSKDATAPTLTLAAAEFYHPELWKPEFYYQWRQQQWEREFPAGAVDVGPLEPLKAEGRD